MAAPNDAQLNSLLKWGIANSDASRDANPEARPDASRGVNGPALNALLGGPTDADMMRASMQVVENGEATLQKRMTAWENFEQLLQSLDNANLLEPLSLWTRLLAQLDHPEHDSRRMAAWCVGTAVQNNIKSQERLLAMDGVAKLAKMAVHEEHPAARHKSIYALSSSMRNYQAATNEAVKHLPEEMVQAESVMADDMDKIDEIMHRLRA